MAPQAPMCPSCDTAGNSLSTALAKCSNISPTFKSQEHFLCPHFHFFSLRHLTHLTNPCFETHFETYLANSEVTALGFFLTKCYFSLPSIAFFYSIISLSRMLVRICSFPCLQDDRLVPTPLTSPQLQTDHCPICTSPSSLSSVFFLHFFISLLKLNEFLPSHHPYTANLEDMMSVYVPQADAFTSARLSLWNC